MLRRTVSQMGRVDLASALNKKDLFVQGGYINGKVVEKGSDGKTYEVLHACSQRPLGTIPSMTKEDTERAIDAAHNAFGEWAATTPQKRSRILWKWASLMQENIDDLAAIMSAESGKTFAEATGETTYSKGYVEWYAGEAERVYGDIINLSRPGVRALVRKEPIGVVGVITPWNFPSAMITRAAAGALAAGCTVVIKPSEITPFSASALAKLAAEAGVPDGVLNVVTGDSSVIGPVITSSKDVRKLSFTGSTAVGQKLYEQCAGNVKKMALELGGNAPVIVCNDAELKVTIDGLMAAKFRNAGQACIAANRIYIPESRFDEFANELVARVKRDLRVGDAGSSKLSTTEKDKTMGPLITVAAGEKVAKVVERAKQQGAKVLTGGRHPEGRGKNFYEPTVLEVKEGTEVTNCEIFGPVASLIRYKDDDLDRVVKAANDVPAGLAGYVFTTDYKKMWQISEKLHYGMVGVNEGAISSPAAPFGGMKESGLGRDGSKYGIEAFMETKYVLMGGNI
jgi:succinate-semialdehyde dehydrogenase/glutarate-semialdehyde dehydrogenase